MEVESQKMAHHRKALENYSKAVEEQRNRLGQVRVSAYVAYTLGTLDGILFFV